MPYIFPQLPFPVKHPLWGSGFFLYLTVHTVRTRPLAFMIFAPLMRSACTVSWRKPSLSYHLPEFTNDNSLEGTLSFLHESDSSHYSTCMYNARQLRSRKRSPCKASFEVAVSVGHIPTLTSKRAGCVTFQQQVQLGTAIQLQGLIPVTGATCSLSVTFGKKQKNKNKNSLLVIRRSCWVSTRLTLHLCHTTSY